MSKPNFVNNWIAGASDTRSLRRRLMAVLRMSSMAMGPSRKRLGLGSLGVVGASLAAAMSFAPAMAQQLPLDGSGNLNIGSNVVTTHDSYVFGANNEVKEHGSIVTGHDNKTSARSFDTVVQGAGNNVDGDRNVVSGALNTTSGNRLTAIGMQNNVSGYRGTAIGQNNVVTKGGGLALGTTNRSDGENSVAIGDSSAALGDSTIAMGQNARTAAGVARAIALGSGSRANNAGDIALGSGAVTATAIGTSGVTINGTNYDFAGSGPTSTLSIGNVGFERTITNVAAGRVSATSTDGVNGSQLHATNLALADLNDGAVKYDRNPDGSVNKDNIALEGAISTDGGATGGTKITNLAQGAVNNGSTDAINGTQLFGVSQSIVNHLGGGTVNPDGSITGPTYVIQGSNATTIKQAFEEVDDSLTTINNSLTNITNGGGIKYFHANSTKADSAANGTDSVAVGPEAVANGDRSVAMGAGAKADHADSVALGSGSVTSEAKGTSGTTINGDNYDFAGTNPKGTVSVGDKDSERTITNVAAGEVSETSTDAVNGSQLHATNQAVEKLGDRVTDVEGDIIDIKGDITNIQGDITNIQDGVEGAVKYDRNRDGTVNKESITLEGKDGTKITNLQDGEVSKDSTDAVNGSQLHETNVKIADLDDSAVKYKKNPDGSKSNEVALEGGDPNAPVLISNVADGKVESGSTEAVNGGQLYQVKTEGKNYTDQKFTEANSYTDQKFTEANNYTDNKFNQLSSEIGDVRKEARQAAAVGLAAASLRFDDRPGKLSAAVGGGFWRSEGALALGMGYTSEDGRIRSNLSATTSGGHWGVGAGLSYTFN